MPLTVRHGVLSIISALTHVSSVGAEAVHFQGVQAARERVSIFRVSVDVVAKGEVRQTHLLCVWVEVVDRTEVRQIHLFRDGLKSSSKVQLAIKAPNGHASSRSNSSSNNCSSGSRCSSSNSSSSSSRISSKSHRASSSDHCWEQCCI